MPRFPAAPFALVGVALAAGFDLWPAVAAVVVVAAAVLGLRVAGVVIVVGAFARLSPDARRDVTRLFAALPGRTDSKK